MKLTIAFISIIGFINIAFAGPNLNDPNLAFSDCLNNRTENAGEFAGKANAQDPCDQNKIAQAGRLNNTNATGDNIQLPNGKSKGFEEVAQQ